MSEQKKVTIEVVEDFKFAYRGGEVVEYKKGAVVEVDEEVAALAKSEKWAKASKAAPETNEDAEVPEAKDE